VVEGLDHLERTRDAQVRDCERHGARDVTALEDHVPESGRVKPVMRFTSVVFPEPLGQLGPEALRASIKGDMSTATTEPYFLVRSLTDMMTRWSSPGLHGDSPFELLVTGAGRSA